MIWKNAPTVEGLNIIQKGSMGEHLGIESTEIGDDYLLAKMPVNQNTKQPLGLLHGGASVALAAIVSRASPGPIDGPVRVSKSFHLKWVASLLTPGFGTPNTFAL